MKVFISEVTQIFQFFIPPFTPCYRIYTSNQQFFYPSFPMYINQAVVGSWIKIREDIGTLLIFHNTDASIMIFGQYFR